MGWIGVDFDGTLVTYGGWKGANNIGNPIAPMVASVKYWLDQGQQVRIYTARVWPLPGVKVGQGVNEVMPIEPLTSSRMEEIIESVGAIRQFCLFNLGRELDITCVKDIYMKELWDDRCRQVITNTGRVVQ